MWSDTGSTVLKSQGDRSNFVRLDVKQNEDMVKSSRLQENSEIVKPKLSLKDMKKIDPYEELKNAGKTFTLKK